MEEFLSTRQHAQAKELTRDMLNDIVSIAIPASIGVFLSFLKAIINFIFAGHTGNPNIVVGIGIGGACVNVVALFVVFGMNGAIETFVS
jgi:Na+-driven multidrug efflux pump